MNGIGTTDARPERRKDRRTVRSAASAPEVTDRPIGDILGL
jgi:hypothetical protein